MVQPSLNTRTFSRHPRQRLSTRLVFCNISVLQWSFLLACAFFVVLFVSIHQSVLVVVMNDYDPFWTTFSSTTTSRIHVQQQQRRRVSLRAVQLVDTDRLDTVQQLLQHESSSENNLKVHHHHKHKRKRVVKLGKAINYSYDEPKDTLPKECEPLADWQTALHLSCNPFHEMDMLPDTVALINWGAYREVYRISDYTGKPFAIKVLTMDEEFDKEFLEKHRKDALAFEQLSASPYVANMYGACRNSALFDFAEGGDLRDLRESGDLLNKTEYQRLEIARDAAMAVADFHIPSQKIPNMVSMFHGDTKDNQFILINGRYRFNDFNKAHFVSYNPKTNKTCPYKSGSSPGRWRSPEEYKIDVLTEKIDVWSLGVVLSCILTGEEPYDPMRSKQVGVLVRNGGRINVTNEEILHSNHTFHKSMLKAMDMALVHDPNKRATARQVAEYLDAALKSMEEHENGGQ